MINTAIDVHSWQKPATAVFKTKPQIVKNIQETPPSIFLDWRARLKEEVRELSSECSREGWDGEDALPISEYGLKAAEHFVDLLPEGIEPPFVTPENTGDIAFDWDLGKKMTFAVIVSGDYAIYAGICGIDRRSGKIRVYDELPTPVKDILVQYFKK